MKAMKKNTLGVSPVIAVILMVAITVVLAGVVFLWAQSFTDEAGGGVDLINVKGSVDATLDELTIEVVSGTYTWGDYRVTVDGVTFDDTGVITESSAGETVVYSETAATLDITTGTEVTVKIVDIAQDKVVWEDDIIAV